MKLVTRILSFEWFAVCLIACVCAFGIKVLTQSAQRIEELTSVHSAQSASLFELSSAYQQHAIIQGRSRLKETRPQELRIAEKHIREKLKELPSKNFPSSVHAQLKKLDKQTSSYLYEQETLEGVLATINKAQDLLEREQRSTIRAAQEPAEAGITLLSIVGAVAILLSLILSARSSRAIGQPLETLHRTVLDLTKPENAHRRIPDGDYDPNLRELGKAINQLAERLEQAQNSAQKEDKLMHSSAQYLVEGLIEPWIISDLSGRTRLSNNAARELLRDYSPEELGIPERIRSALSETDGNKLDTVEVLVSSSGLKIGFAIRLQPPKTV